MELKWTRNENGDYDSNAKHWCESQHRHLPMFTIRDIRDWSSFQNWQLVTRTAAGGLRTAYCKLNDAKRAAQKYWDAIPAIETDEDKGWRAATGFK